MAALPPNASDTLSRATARFRDDLGRVVVGVDDAPVGLAVSGGTDSMAMLVLATAALPDRVRAVTFDHGLRPAAADEAAMVGRWCERAGVPHTVLAPPEPLPKASVQAAARRARYAAMNRWAAETGVHLLATAHHADDQAETFLMRANRGSGLAGLAGIRARRSCWTPTDGAGGARVPITIIRPLLGWRRADLAAVVAAAGIVPVHDPSNTDDRYDRARMRNAMGEAGWLRPDRIAASAATLTDAEEALAWTTGRMVSERCDLGEDEATLDPFDLPSELRRRLVLRCLQQVDPDVEPRGTALIRFTEALNNGRPAMLGTVLARPCRDGTGRPIWRFAKAPPRRAQ